MEEETGMSHLLFDQFELTRSLFLKEIESLPKDLLDLQPKGLNNTIHWHIGHVLTVTEQFMFRFPKKSTFLPESHMMFFANGTKPSDWESGVPSVEVLIEQLKGQLIRIKEIPVESFDYKFSKPVMGFESFGGLATMALFHEANHLGQIHSMKLALDEQR